MLMFQRVDCAKKHGVVSVRRETRGWEGRGEDLVYIRLPESSNITHHRSVIHSILRQHGT